MTRDSAWRNAPMIDMRWSTSMLMDCLATQPCECCKIASAALALLAIVGAGTIGITSALQWIMVLQLSILLIASMKRDADGDASS
jgi:hypothetical protein